MNDYHFGVNEENLITDHTHPLHKEIEHLRAELAALKAEREWRPIKTFPRDGNDYLVCDRRVLGGNQMVVAWDEDDNDYPLLTADGPGYPLRAFTHWMPLPAPPEAGNE